MKSKDLPLKIPADIGEQLKLEDGTPVKLVVKRDRLVAGEITAADFSKKIMW